MPQRRNAEELFRLLDAALAVGSAAAEAGEPTDREVEALRALVRALCGGWPSVTQRWLADSPQARELLAEPPTGREIKLMRIAEARLAEVL